MDGLIVIDRSTDWVTPMMTMLTYEGLLAEYVGIQHCERDDSLSPHAVLSTWLTSPSIATRCSSYRGGPGALIDRGEPTSSR